MCLQKHSPGGQTHSTVVFLFLGIKRPRFPGEANLIWYRGPSFPSKYSSSRGAESSSSLRVPMRLRSKAGGTILSGVRGFAAGDVKQALPHLENPLRRMGRLHQIGRSFPALKRKMLSTLLPTEYALLFLCSLSNVAVIENTNV